MTALASAGMGSGCIPRHSQTAGICFPLPQHNCSRAEEQGVLPRSGPHAPGLPQRLSTLAHGQLGTCALFLVPVGPDQHGMCYEAVFA